MVRLSDKLIQRMVEAIVQEVKPERVFLFGSCARNTPTSDSDVDFLIIESEAFGPGRNRWSELRRIRKVLKPFRFPKDILVYSRDEFEKWQDSINHIIAHATKEGKLVYEGS